MCLQIIDRKIYKADQDIICFKKFDFDQDSEQLISPFRDMLYKLDKTYRRLFFSGPTIDFSKFFRFRIPKNVYSVNIGFHSYRTLQTAQEQTLPEHAIVKCLIPKGSRYILGYNDEYVSLKIKPLEIVQHPTR